MKSTIFNEVGGQHLTFGGSDSFKGGSRSLWHFVRSGAAIGPVVAAEANWSEVSPAMPYSPPRPISMSLLSNFERSDELLLVFCWLLSSQVLSEDLELALHANLRTKPTLLRFAGHGFRMNGEEEEKVVISGGVREREAMA